MNEETGSDLVLYSSKITHLDVIVTKIRLMRRKRELATNGSST